CRGGYDPILEPATKLARLKQDPLKPTPAAQRVYDQLYTEYRTLHDYFGAGGNDVMKRLKNIRAETYRNAQWNKAQCTKQFVLRHPSFVFIIVHFALSSRKVFLCPT